MWFTWDSKKALSNYKKHGVSFELAQTVFEDPLHLSLLDEKKNHEERWATIGHSSNLKLLLVVHTYQCFTNHTEEIRIISARKATKHERKQYEKRI